MKVDWNTDTDGSYTLYDSGAYTVEIKSIEEVMASTGNPQLKVQGTIKGGDFDGKPVTDFITLIESVMWKLVKFFKGFGSVEQLNVVDTNSGEFRALLNKLIGKTTVWVLEQKADRSGILRNNVVDYQIDPNAEAKAEDEAWLE